MKINWFSLIGGIGFLMIGWLNLLLEDKPDIALIQVFIALIYLKLMAFHDD